MTLSDTAAQAAIGVAARDLHLPTVRTESARLAEIAVRERATHLAFLAEVLAAEVDDRTERRRTRRIAEARFPRLKRLAEFNIDAVPGIGAAQLAALAAGAYMDAGEPIVLLGDSGTGKSHLLIGLGLAACEQGRRVRYVTTAQLVNELVEAADDRQLSRVVEAATDAWTCTASTSSATSRSTPAAPSCSSRSSPNAKNAPPSPSPPTCPSPNGAPSSPTPASSQPSSTASPSTPTSSKPAPPPTGCAPPNGPARPGTARLEPAPRTRSDHLDRTTAHRPRKPRSPLLLGTEPPSAHPRDQHR